MSAPLTPTQRVTRLFIECEKLGIEYPSEDRIAEIIHDAEYDTLNYPASVAERHGLPFKWNKSVQIDSLPDSALEDEEEFLDQMIEESNEE